MNPNKLEREKRENILINNKYLGNVEPEAVSGEIEPEKTCQKHLFSSWKNKVFADGKSIEA